ncbi:MAG TPA: isocitrate lyase/phosphoenolpyruvate mutase family protein [Pseudonocardiaceae bacterium]
MQAGRIARAVSVPVTVDAEAGYGMAAGEFVDRLLAAGAVGCNLEDSDHAAGVGLVDMRRQAEWQAEWLAAVRAAADRSGVPLVINARVDVVIAARASGSPVDEPALAEAVIDRARAYLAAGADCVYPITLRDPEVIRQVVAALAPAAVNVLAPLDGVSAAARLGAARVSTASGRWRMAKAALAEQLAVLAAD